MYFLYVDVSSQTKYLYVLGLYALRTWYIAMYQKKAQAGPTLVVMCTWLKPILVERFRKTTNVSFLSKHYLPNMGRFL